LLAATAAADGLESAAAFGVLRRFQDAYFVYTAGVGLRNILFFVHFSPFFLLL
jgi:hypothetical protein